MGDRWGPQPVVIDTRPGAHFTTDGAVQAADLVVVPVPPSRRAIAAVRQMLDEHAGFRIVLVPNMVAGSPREWWLQGLEQFSEDPLVHLAPPVSMHAWLNDWLLTTPVVTLTPGGAPTTPPASSAPSLTTSRNYARRQRYRKRAAHPAPQAPAPGLYDRRAHARR